MKDENKIKIGGILFFIGLMLIIISWYRTFPIYLSSINDITFSQFYPSLWPGITLCSIGLFFVAYYCKSKIIVAACSACFPLLLYVCAFFFPYLASSDSGAARGMFQVFHKTGMNSGVISYFQFPAYFNLNEIIHQIVGVDEKGIAVLSFVLYGILLGLFLFLFFVNMKKLYYNQLVPFLLVFVFFIGMFSFLNYQWVPQTLALVYLFLLLFISTFVFLESPKIHWKFTFIFILIFISLLFTHAFIPVIFLSFFGILTLKKRNFRDIFIIIFSIYIVYTIYYAYLYFPLYIETFSSALKEIGTEYTTTLSQSVKGSVDILSQIISFANRITIPMVWMIGVLGFVVLFFKRKIDFVFISLGVAGGIYLAVGLAFSVLGLRAAQILFIPITIGFMFFVSKWKKPTIAIVVVVLVLSVFGPMRMAYNQTQFQTDGEVSGCNFFIDKTIKSPVQNTIIIDQMDWGYFSNKYEYFRNISKVDSKLFTYPVRPGESGFSDHFFNDSKNSNSLYMLYNSNLGKEIYLSGFSKEEISSRIIVNNKVYDCGSTFIINGLPNKGR